MNLETLKKQLIIDEGRKDFIYSDYDGKPTWPGRTVIDPKTKKEIKDPGLPTFGIGHLLTKNDPEWYAFNQLKPGGILKVSAQRIDEAFKKDVDNALDGCEFIWPEFEGFLEEIKQITTNMVFNMGQPKVSKKFPSFILAIRDRNYKRASLEMKYNNGLRPAEGFCDWYLQTKDRAKRLIARMEVLANNQLCNVKDSKLA
jgi:hypothetical protein